MAGETETHVLLVSISGQGHLNPVLRLARRLSLLGLRPTLATMDLARERVLRHSAAALAASPVSFSFFSDGLPLSYDRWADLPTFFHHLRLQSSSHLDRLISSSPHPFSAIITTPFLPWASEVALRHGLPCALLWIQSLTLFSLYHSDPSAVPTTVPVVADLFRELFTESLKDTTWVLANSFRDLESHPTAGSPPVLFVGPLASSSRTELDMREADDSCMEWLDEREKDGAGSVVYVSFGSIVKLSPELVSAVAEALEASGRHYLWVAKDYDVGRRGEKGKVVAWCEQRKVLEHGAVGCFVSHCGWNSVLEAVAAGVPVVGIPQFGDQPKNAGLMEEWGVGAMVREAAEVGAKMAEVMGSEEVRKRAAELRDKARRAVEEGGSSDDDLRRFVEEVKGAIVHPL